MNPLKPPEASLMSNQTQNQKTKGQPPPNVTTIKSNIQSNMQPNIAPNVHANIAPNMANSQSNIGMNLSMSKPKYTKICPAIAPKPTMNVAPKLPFNPSIPKGKSALQMKPCLSDSLVNSLNTSKTWVLPPRPRPGRKPTGSDNHDSPAGANSSTKKITIRTLPKKRVKVSHGKDVDEKEATSSIPAINTNQITDILPPTPMSELSDSPQTASPPHFASRSEVSQLKETYLSKLKEQELIRSYIEVMTNQIKELSFVQNGVITFDALRNNSNSNLRIKKTLTNNGSSTSITTTSNNASPSMLPIITTSSSTKLQKNDQLESINNINDLNKFLNYLTKSSKIIHSVTKRNKTGINANAINANDLNSSQLQLPQYLEDQDIWLNNQINYYLEVRAKFKAKNDTKLATKTLNTTPEKNLVSSPIVIPDLLKPLTGSFMEEDYLGIIDNDTSSNIANNINDNSALILEDREFDDLIMDANIEPSSDNINLIEDESDILGSVKIHDMAKLDSESSSNNAVTENIIRKKSKLNCGFCSNDTPCLCLDAEIEICNLRK